MTPPAPPPKPACTVKPEEAATTRGWSAMARRVRRDDIVKMLTKAPEGLSILSFFELGVCSIVSQVPSPGASPPSSVAHRRRCHVRTRWCGRLSRYDTQERPPRTHRLGRPQSWLAICNTLALAPVSPSRPRTHLSRPGVRLVGRCGTSLRGPRRGPRRCRDLAPPRPLQGRPAVRHQQAAMKPPLRLGQWRGGTPVATPGHPKLPWHGPPTASARPEREHQSLGQRRQRYP